MFHYPKGAHYVEGPMFHYPKGAHYVEGPMFHYPKGAHYVEGPMFLLKILEALLFVSHFSWLKRSSRILMTHITSTVFQ
jgi:hypothetical protein